MTLTVDSDYIAHLDGATVIDGGWLNHHYIQLAYQIADSVSGLPIRLVAHASFS